MRFALSSAAIAAGSLMLVACDSGSVPSPLERQQSGGLAIEDAAEDDALVVVGNGIQAGERFFAFSADKDAVTTALTGRLGNSEASGMNRECGAGPMQFVQYPGGLSVNFNGEALVGWSVSETSPRLQVSSDVQLGMGSAQVKAADGYSTIEGSSLGEEFAVFGSIGGFITDGEVTLLYAGAQCFAR